MARRPDGPDGPFQFVLFSPGAVITILRVGSSSSNDERFRRLVEDAQDIIYTCDPRGFVTYVNPTGARLMRYDAAELVGRHFLTLIHLDYRVRSEELYRR